MSTPTPLGPAGAPGRPSEVTEARPPRDEADLRFWLENMAWYHGYTLDEIAAATGLSVPRIAAALKRFDITPAHRPRRTPEAPLRVWPYPGGRHPRRGFLEGTVNPQRETKFSVFTPWDEASYVVVDLPEAIWSHLGLTYLAHTHLPTLWSRQNVTLPRQEWERHADGTLTGERCLPNGIAFGAKVLPGQDGVRMELWLHNGTDGTLTDLRVQNCVLLQGAAGFQEQTNANKTFAPPFAAGRSADGNRWVITAWERCDRAWGNEQCPCLHADPKFPDCAPGATPHLRGWLSFYEGEDLAAEMFRIAHGGWLRIEEGQRNE